MRDDKAFRVIFKILEGMSLIHNMKDEEFERLKEAIRHTREWLDSSSRRI